jgi:phosphate transport system permease protein
MTTDTAPRTLANSYTAGKLPKAAPWAVLAISLAVCLGAGLIMALSADEEFNWILALIAGVLLFVLANWIISRLVEGARQAADRLITSLVTAAFVLALIPLIWLTITVVVDGRPCSTARSSTARCATSSARAAALCMRSSARS